MFAFIVFVCVCQYGSKMTHFVSGATGNLNSIN